MMRRNLCQVILNGRTFSQGAPNFGNKTESVTCPFKQGSLNSPTATATASDAAACPNGHIDGISAQSKLASPDSDNVLENTKPYSEMPSPAGLPFIGTVLDYVRNGGGKYLHEYVNKRHAELGPIYKEKYSLEPIEVLFVGDTEGFRDIYRNEGHAPFTFNQPPFEHFIKLYGMKRGLFFMQGDEWLKFRKPMNNLFLKRTDYYELFDENETLISEYLNRWNKIAAANDGYIANVEKDIHELGLEAQAVLLLGKNFTKHRSKIEEGTQQFYHYSKVVWETNMRMQVIPPKWAQKFNLKVWKEFSEANRKILNMGHAWTKLAMSDILNESDPGKLTGLLHIMLREYGLDEKDVGRIFADFIATNEAESLMMEWLIYVMGRHPEAQEKALAEILKVCGSKKGIKQTDLVNLPYLGSCVKEILRMYPSSAFTVRILPKDALIKGYKVPAGTVAALSLYSSQRDPNVFPEPDRFWPERWSRVKVESGQPSDDEILECEPERKPIGVRGGQPYMSFAWGTRRGCIFRKLSVIRMNLFLGKLIQEFAFETSEVKPIMRSLLIPDRDMKLKLTKRR